MSHYLAPGLYGGLRRATFAVLLCFALLLFSSCASAADKTGGKAAAPSREDLIRQIDPSAWKLSSQAEHLYYYLVLTSAIADNSREEITIALEALLKLDPSLEVYQDSVTIMLSRGEFAKARQTALAGLDKFPGDNLITLLLSAAYSEAGQTSEAIQLLEKHVADNAADKEAMQELVRLYINSGQEEKVGPLFSRLPETDMSAEADLFRAGVLGTVGRNAEAHAILDGLLKKDPKNFEAWLELAYLHEREKKPEEAIKAYRKAAELMPDSAELNFRLATLYIEQKKPAEAMQALNAALFSPQMGIQASLRFAEAGFYKEALEMLDKAGEAGGDPDQLALVTSMLLQDSGANLLEGLAPLERIKPASPFYPSALQQKARLYLAAGEYAKAHAAALDGRKQFPDQKELWGLEAYALIRQKKIGDAEALLHKGLKQYPDDEELLFALGSVQDEVGKKDEAMKTMERILMLNPSNYQALNYVGYTLADAGKDLNRALVLITAALKQRPNADYIVDSLAWVQYRLGRFEEAWESITRCITLGGDDATIWEHYGDIALALGKKDEAIKGYTEAILRKPDNIEAVREKLAALKKQAAPQFE
jgi:tetratricopeptide (TPR) repeat protein